MQKNMVKHEDFSLAACERGCACDWTAGWLICCDVVYMTCRSERIPNKSNEDTLGQQKAAVLLTSQVE